MKQTTKEDTIIIFSDNGSQSQPKTIDGPFEFIEGSSGTIEKIWRPTLIVRSNKPYINQGITNELVSTTDIFSIIIDSCGIDPKTYQGNRYIDSLLPPSLGGKESRKVAETFGINYENQYVLEWCRRYNHNNGDYRTFNVKGMDCKPIIELINDLGAIKQND